jgi:hypothetical protein
MKLKLPPAMQKFQEERKRMMREMKSNLKGDKTMSKPKKLAHTLIHDEIGTDGAKSYVILRDLVERYHEDLRNAKIVLMFNHSWKPNADGRMTLGNCQIVSAKNKELAEYDIIIAVSEVFWTDPGTTDKQRTALLDHELCHAMLNRDEDTGEPIIDERDRYVYRLRKHDVEEFESIIKRYGTYKRDLERFAAALSLSKQIKDLEVEAE